MKHLKPIALSLFMGMGALLLQHTAANATVVPTNWFSNSTTVVNVEDPAGSSGPERFRLLTGFNNGHTEGMVTLPFSANWTIESIIRTDGQHDIPTEYVRIFIDDFTPGNHVAEFFNTPLATSHLFSHSFNGDKFNFRFEFFSPVTVSGSHLIVQPGTVSTPMPEPGTLAILGLGLAGLAVARRRRMI